MEHSITLKDRSSLHISGIEHIYSFNDKKVGEEKNGKR